MSFSRVQETQTNVGVLEAEEQKEIEGQMVDSLAGFAYSAL